MLANTTVLAVFCAAAEQKSALYKIYDRKARRFRGIFVSVGRSNALALREQTEQKAPKYAALRRVRDLIAHPKCYAIPLIKIPQNLFGGKISMERLIDGEGDQLCAHIGGQLHLARGGDEAFFIGV